MTLKGKTAFVTGGASGLGLGIAKALAQDGVDLALADLQQDALAVACETVRGLGVKAVPIRLDVSDDAAVQRASSAVVDAFGRVDILVNNAGVAVTGVPIEQVTVDEWNWTLGVNLFGVVNCIRHFLPHIRAGGAGHVVNVASIGGLHVSPTNKTGAYAASKYAVVALSEALDHDLQGTGIVTSVVCPAAIRTQIAASSKLRPERFGGSYDQPMNINVSKMLAETGIDPALAGRRVVDGMKNREFFIFTHASCRSWIEDRHRRIMAGFDAADRYGLSEVPAA